MEKINSIRYFKRETGGIVKLTNNVIVHSLDLSGEWIPNQYLISMFIDGMGTYNEISEEQVNEIIAERKQVESRTR